ncbi:sugar phosphate isomerase/epimerase [Natranaerovirga pectinivora]|uniref:Sugar phosphate isomerase/epimerase n=1 Tax=Natranaerovirga pectinivora TaxID=682400 RepID=A0A4R3MMR0_9FIRM|nr:sugar phosphate isomerase/epimerase family protein [Natranaerovirga pectinivora]TCT16255.1 sugar phosphate isomerase/epimerase [Natranaerovirga pectinivora]
MIRFSATITAQYDTGFSPFLAKDYDKSLDWLQTSGFDAAEICISNYENIDPNKIKRDLDKRGLDCSTISTGQSRTLENISLIHEDINARKKAQERMKEHIDAASILGSKVTLGLLRGLGDSSLVDEQKIILAKSLEPIIAHAEEKKVTIILEPINRYETVMLNSAQDTVNYIKNDLGNPNCIGILWDVFHANIEDVSFESAIDIMGEKLKHVHLADSNRMFPGHGHIDFEKIYKKLVKVGYNQYMSFECLNQPLIDSVINESKDFIQSLKSMSV